MSPSCPYGDFALDNAYHTFYEFTRWTTERGNLEDKLRSINRDPLIKVNATKPKRSGQKWIRSLENPQDNNTQRRKSTKAVIHMSSTPNRPHKKR